MILEIELTRLLGDTGYPEYIKDCYRTRAKGRTSLAEYHDIPRQEMEMDGKIWSGFRGWLILREYDLFPFLCYHIRGIVAEIRLHPADKSHILGCTRRRNKS